MTFRFRTNGHYREEGWSATVTAIAKPEPDNYKPEPPIILKDVCGHDISLFANPGYTIYYTTNGDTPNTSSTEYTGAFPIDFENSDVTVKAIASNGTLTTEVASTTFKHTTGNNNDFVPDPDDPTITFNGNTVTMTVPTVPDGVNETYYVYYTTNGSTPDPIHVGESYPTKQYSEPFEWYMPGTTFKAIAQASSCEDKKSAVVSKTLDNITVPNPVITFDNNGKTTITCALDGVTIYYTTNGTEPTTSSSTYSAPFYVSMGATVKAFANKSGTGYANSGNSSVVSAIYTAGQSSGTTGDIVFLDDREDHSWSYYKRHTKKENGVEVLDNEKNSPIRSWNPADVKITYFGNGIGTLTNNSENGDTPTTFSANATNAMVGIGPGETQSTFVYLKTLERTDGSTADNPSGRCEYSPIPNPFQVRPVFVSRGSSGTPTYPQQPTIVAYPIANPELPETQSAPNPEATQSATALNMTNPDAAGSGTRGVASVAQYFNNVTATSYNASTSYVPADWATSVNDHNSLYNGVRPRVSNHSLYDGIDINGDNYLLMTLTDALTSQDLYATMPSYSNLISFEFNYKFENSNYGTLEIGTMVGTTFNTVKTLTRTTTTTNYPLTQAEINTINTRINNNSNTRIAFYFHGTTYIPAFSIIPAHLSVGIDDVVITYSDPTTPPPAPEFSLAGGTYVGQVNGSVTISDADPFTTIYYTINGSTPTTSSTPYTGPVTVHTGTTLKAIAVNTLVNTSGEHLSSSVTEATYSFKPTKPTFTPGEDLYNSVIASVSIESDAGTTIYYTINNTQPTTTNYADSGDSPKATSAISQTTTLRAIAVDAENNVSEEAIANYNIMPGAPTFSPAEGFYIGAQSVTIDGGGFSVYYTTDGTIPTIGSTLYSGAISVSATTTIKAIAVDAFGVSSDVATASYGIGQSAANNNAYRGFYKWRIKAIRNGKIYDAATDGTEKVAYSGSGAVGANNMLDAEGISTISSQTANTAWKWNWKLSGHKRMW
jgi:hypothetical protein